MGFLDSLKSQANDLQKKLNELQNLQNGSSETDMPQSPVPPTPPAPPAPSAQESSSSKQIYNPYLENLIEMALADGELTEKEKQVLFKKAEAQGIDLDEFEIIDKNIDLINKIPNIENVEPMTHCLDDFIYELRNDEIEESTTIEDALSNCDDKTDREISVPKVVG